MACLPLIERELRIALRKQRPIQERLKVAAIAAAGSVMVVLLGSLTRDPHLGRMLEQALCLAGLSFVLRAPGLTAGALAEERRNQTLGLLFLSGLNAWEVFASKFLSAALVAFTRLLAIFPMLALPFLTGGVSFDVFLATVFALPALMLFTLSLSLLASVLTREDGAAVILALTLGALLCLGLPQLYRAQVYFSPGATPFLWWWRLSPGYGPFLVWKGLLTGFRTGDRAEFWLNQSITLLWSLLALAAAAFALKRLWREREVAATDSGWRQHWRRLLHGDRQRRQRLARTWLEVNPFVWFAAHDRQPVALGWLVVGGLVVLWLLCWAAWPARWPSIQNFFITATVLNSLVAWVTRHTAAQALAQPRHDGSYEFLLTTPLHPGELVWGVLEALRCQFQTLATCVFGLNVLMMLAGARLRPWTLAAFIVYVGVWFVLLTWSWNLGHRWSRLLPVMWASLNSGRPAWAAWRATGINGWSWFWILFNLQYLARGFGSFPSGSGPELVLVSLLAFFFLLTWIARSGAGEPNSMKHLRWSSEANAWRSLRPKTDPVTARLEGRLVSEFREIVREPLPDPADPRFKKWNPTERFPWGWGLIQQRLHERLARR